MTDEVVSVRAEILRNVPNSKLFLKDKQLDHQSVRDQVVSRFAAHGICPTRLLLEGKSSRYEYLKCYHRVDIALSPFPYGGGTTSVEGLWMGVPVITRQGSYFLSHLGESIAHNSKMSDWIAQDNEDYVEKATRFSSDLNSLGELRHSLREKLLRTPLYDLPRFAGHFEKALWKMRETLDHRERHT
jgi:predicted O-linked N-acetylglucosamine transferase (SPINDLY family)